MVDFSRLSAAMLARYLQAEAGRRYSLGSADCVTLAAGWLAVRRGIDPAAILPRYASAAEAAALLPSWGGVARCVGRAMRRCGIPMTRDPKPGDVAFVALREGLVAVAIRTGRGWVIRFEDGIASLPFAAVRVVAAWSV